MTTRLYAGEHRIAALDARDRGLAYGDGVFETILVHDGTTVWWDAHLERLARGCAKLGIDAPAASFLRGESDAVIEGCARGVLKLIVTRGAGARGYAASGGPATTVIALSGAPPSPRGGLRLRWCATPLARQPALAGLKHLNRLEQVLARAEWSDPDIDEGLQCDTSGHAVCATAANLFVLREGRWLTPPVDAAGVAGTCRAWLLAHVPDAHESTLLQQDVESADAVVLCNAVRGILPVAALGARRWPTVHAGAENLVRQLAEAEPAFAGIRPVHRSEEA